MHSESLENIVLIHKEKISKLREYGIDPYPNKFDFTHTLSEIIQNYKNLAPGEHSSDEISICGRLISRREMGKATFCHLQDSTSKLQIYLRQEIVSEQQYKIFHELIDIGDFLGITGNPFKTRTGELTVNTTRFQILSKSLRPLPEKWHGLKDIEIRYRQRYLDLISNPSVKEIFFIRAKIINLIREFLNRNNFLEVETPIIQYLPGGAIAKPFKTYHNAYNSEFYLRIAPEIYLKMLLIGGFERIYELGKSFRNEGVDRRHNPEFTMLEIYQAYANYEDMIELCKSLLEFVVKNLNLPTLPELNFKTVTLEELFKETFGEKTDIIKIINEGKLLEFAKEINFEIKDEITEKKIFDHIFEEYIQKKLIEPTFVLNYPVEFSPLAKSQSNFAERFELFIQTEEIANAYSELNDPQEQEKRFGNEIHPMDEKFITALEYGMPPAAGLGIGIDRLTMVITNSSSIRDVVLFPLLRPES